ncbi:MAG: NUDIX hydrolase [Pseudomonadota bacterium]
MAFCLMCGTVMELRIPEFDDRLRPVCPRCGYVHYTNPKMVVGCIPERDGAVLLCRRDIEPRRGKWTLPAGYLENDETVLDGAVRETLEETRARVVNVEPFRMYNLVFINQIYMMFRSTLTDTDFGPTPESIEVRLFPESGIPWEDLAFPVIRETLLDYFRQRKTGDWRFAMKDIRTRQAFSQLGDFPV